jgi:aspartate carbamoyltransferase catalytic subunit
MKLDLISINDLERADIERYLRQAAAIEAVPRREKLDLLRGYILLEMFFEPSTRTKLSFEAAMRRLGGDVMGFSDVSTTSVKKGESFRDTVRTVQEYADILAIRHAQEGTARLAAETSRLPVLNAGDGTNQHPTQTLLDMYTIQKFFGRVRDLKICLAGDLRYSRTVYSLLKTLMMFEGNEFLLCSPESLRVPEYLKYDEEGRRQSFVETDDLAAAVRNCDVLYVTRIQKERFADIVEYEKVKNVFELDARMLRGARPHMKVLHPLPRVNEIKPDVDATPHAGYFEQVGNGMIMRQAILMHHLGVTL